MTLFDHPEEVGQVFEESAESAEGGHKPEPAAVKRPSRWSVRNWPVRWKVLAIALLPLTLAGLFGGLRISNALTEANRLRLVADRAEMIPAITNYMSALGDALVAASSDGDAEGARKNFENRKYELQSRLSHTDVATDVRSGVESLIERGQGLLSSVSTTGVGLRDEVTGYAPILLTAEDAINGSVRVDSERIRAQTEGLSRAVGARGQMMMQELLVNRGGELPDPELRSSMMTLAGTEPSTLFGMSEVLGVDSPDAKSLQQQLVTRMSIMSDPEQVLPNNPVLRDSIRTTDQIAAQLISENTGAVTAAVEDRAADRRAAALRDIVLVLAAITATLLAVWLVARSLVRPLRTLRDSALQVAHVDLEQEIARLRAGVPGSDRDPDPLPVYTTEEVGQVAHAVDELHAQALLLAGDEARLRRLVNEMFETMSRRNRSLVDQQLALIDRLERNEDDPDRLESLFRLDHLAARMRRNGANLLVLAGARVPHERGRPVPLATLISAAASEVEGYDRVQTVLVPDTTVIGAAAADCIHLLAELIDNALRYSAPTEPVRVVAGFENDGGVVVEVVDVGLGMTDADLRMANMRLAAGGEFSPENARHMGLFVISRLAARHEIEVRLFPASQGSRGITAEVYLPPHLLTVRPFEEPSPALATPAQPYFAPAEQPQPAPQRDEPEPYEYEPEPYQSYAPYQDAEPAEPGPVVSLLPRRTPGSSGITGMPSEQPEQPAQPPTAPERVRRELPQPWWEAEEQGAGQPDAPAPHGAPEPVAEKFAPADTSGYFAARARLGAAAPEPEPQREPEPETETETETETDSIYQRMLSESVGIDPNEPSLRADLDWQSVWDRGWSVAAEAENVPVVAHTEHGLPVREPGARLVPGSAAAAAPAEEDPHAAAHDPADAEQPVTSNGVPPQPAHEPLERDPAAIRTSISSHFGGVHAARSHARENGLQGGLDKGLEKGPENGLDTDQGQNQ
ncbi:histidine kinase [Mycolicibacter heraklionensis]|uniref:histidine kinase n=1 Tax=Mycolicibacter heraklionensis TaxID=512402 RepID=A0AA91EVW7_9MYCO|nr:ATP-binding protein [Mycolicibacter heraklionensis]OBK86236.1 histidine kinase [Mycolicibacter heraklionensis]